MSMVFDEYGRPFIILRDGGDQERLQGKKARKQNILAARSIANIMKSSLGPKGMDKILVSSDGQVTITNDGATILKEMDVENQVGKLMVELSQSQDDEIGDGTTGVVVFAGALLAQAEALIEKGIHPTRIADGFEAACSIAVDHLTGLADTLEFSRDNTANLHQVVRSCISSKVIKRCEDLMAQIAVDAILSVADLERKDVNLSLIKVEGKPGGKMEDSQLIRGILLNKHMSHPQMPKEIKDAKIVILTCAFEPPKAKTKYALEIKTTEQYKALDQAEQAWFVEMVQKVKDSGANLVMCQWGFDDEANHLLLQNELPAIRWVGGTEIELLAIATGARIVPRFEDISPEKLGKAGVVREIELGTTKENIVIVEDCANTNAVTIFVRGGNGMIIEEIKRSIHDALCVVRSLVKERFLIVGGGAPEMELQVQLEKWAKTLTGINSHCVRAFAQALEIIPATLAENAGMHPVTIVTALRKLHNEGKTTAGINVKKGVVEELDEKVLQPLLVNTSAISLASEAVRMIMKIDDMVTSVR